MTAVGLAACGLIAPILFTGIVLIGAQMRPDYSHKSRAISELVERDAPNKRLLDGAFAIYHILHILGAIGIYLSTQYMKGHWYDAAAMLVTTAVISVVLAIFPPDPLSREASVPSTRSGKIYVATLFVVSLFTMITLGLYANAGINTYSRFKGFGVFTAIMLAIMLGSGIVTAAMTVKLHPSMGYAERVYVGSYMVWFFVTCCMVLSYYFPSPP